MILNYSKVKNYLYNAGFKGLALEAAVKICACESSFNTNAHNTSGENSKGLMQINVDAHPEYKNLDLFDPVINTKIAYKIYKQTNNFSAWTCAKKLNLVNPNNIYFGIGVVFIATALYIITAQ
jgi:hypothetical protein